VRLQCLVLDYRTGELVVRCLYRSRGDSNPGTRDRRREVLDLTRGGLSAALEALEGRVDVVGTSGFTREDVFLCTTKGGATPDEHKTRAEEPDGRNAWRAGRGLERSLRVNKVRHLGNGWLGRARTRRRMKSRDRGYVGSEKVLNGPVKRRTNPDPCRKGWK
jgi:hypothetical protein